MPLILKVDKIYEVDKPDGKYVKKYDFINQSGISEEELKMLEYIVEVKGENVFMHGEKIGLATL